VLVRAKAGGAGGACATSTLTIADADFVESAMLVATRWKVDEAVTLGAVNIPDDETVPPDAVHFTAGVLAFVTRARNWWLAPEDIVTLAGEISTETGLLGAACCTFTKKVFTPSAMLFLSVTEIVKLNLPISLGVPETVPVVAFRARPGGSVPRRVLK
jgi:hypothetical protein